MGEKKGSLGVPELPEHLDASGVMRWPGLHLSDTLWGRMGGGFSPIDAPPDSRC